jgi:hypothetical protein
MSIRTWLRYLIGDRQAILELAAAPQALFVGALFVLSAGFAREYDAEDLLHEPWHLLLPFAASLITSVVIFLPCYGLAYRKRGGTTVPPLWPAYRSFLGLFWLTAPLAWLYAVPYERFLSPIDSIKANLWTLGIVSVWRVFLMIRVIGVWMGFGWPAMFLVLLIANVEALIAIRMVPRPIVGLMSGVRLTPAEELIANTTRLVEGLACLSLPALLVFACAVVFGQKPRWPPADDALPTRERARTLGALAVCSVLLWFFTLPFTQPEQIRRHEVERAFRQGRISDGLAAMSAHQPADYPPYWDPPPRPAWGGHRDPNSHPKLGEIYEAIAVEPPAPWVRAIYYGKLEQYLQSWELWHWDQTEIRRVVRAIAPLPEEAALLARILRDGGESGHQLKELLKEGLPSEANPPPTNPEPRN